MACRKTSVDTSVLIIPTVRINPGSRNFYQVLGKSGNFILWSGRAENLTKMSRNSAISCNIVWIA